MESEPCVSLRLFGTLSGSDTEDYRLYMESAREDLNHICAYKCEEYSYNFFEDCVQKAFQRTRFQWEEQEKPAPKDDALFGYEGRASIASIGNLSTMQSLGPDLDFDRQDIPEIPFHKLGGTTLTNDDIVNCLPDGIEETAEEDQEPAFRLPYSGGEQSPGDLLSHRK